MTLSLLSQILLELEIVSSLLIGPIIAFKSWEVVVVGTWIWLKRSTRFWRCLYKAMSKPYKNMLACVFCNCLRTLSSSLGVCWVALFKASIVLFVSRCGGLKCLPPRVMWEIFDGSFDSVSWGLKCLPLYVDVGSFDRGLKFLHMWMLDHLMGFEVSPSICGC